MKLNGLPLSRKIFFQREDFFLKFCNNPWKQLVIGQRILSCFISSMIFFLCYNSNTAEFCTKTDWRAVSNTYTSNTGCLEANRKLHSCTSFNAIILIKKILHFFSANNGICLRCKPIIDKKFIH